jgi:hypothetical protein
VLFGSGGFLGNHGILNSIHAIARSLTLRVGENAAEKCFDVLQRGTSNISLTMDIFQQSEVNGAEVSQYYLREARGEVFLASFPVAYERRGLVVFFDKRQIVVLHKPRDGQRALSPRFAIVQRAENIIEQ